MLISISLVIDAYKNQSLREREITASDSSARFLIVYFSCGTYISIIRSAGGIAAQRQAALQQKQYQNARRVFCAAGRGGREHITTPETLLGANKKKQERRWGRVFWVRRPNANRLIYLLIEEVIFLTVTWPQLAKTTTIGPAQKFVFPTTFAQMFFFNFRGPNTAQLQRARKTTAQFLLHFNKFATLKMPFFKQFQSVEWIPENKFWTNHLNIL